MRNNMKGQRGYTFIEVLVILAIVGTMSAIALPFFHRIYTRNRLRSTVQDVYSMVLATRMQAVKRNQVTILQVVMNNPSLCGQSSKCMIMWVDNVPNNYVQDAGEPTIQQQSIPDYIYFRRAPSGSLNGGSAVSFDGLSGRARSHRPHRFSGRRHPGGANLPQFSAAASPRFVTATVPHGSIDCNPSSRCRGIYLADNNQTGFTANRNVFRISVDDYGRTGRVSLLKWLPTSDGGNAGENNYVPGPWVWAD